MIKPNQIKWESPIYKAINYLSPSINWRDWEWFSEGVRRYYQSASSLVIGESPVIYSGFDLRVENDQVVLGKGICSIKGEICLNRVDKITPLLSSDSGQIITFFVGIDWDNTEAGPRTLLVEDEILIQTTPGTVITARERVPFLIQAGSDIDPSITPQPYPERSNAIRLGRYRTDTRELTLENHQGWWLQLHRQSFDHKLKQVEDEHLNPILGGGWTDGDLDLKTISDELKNARGNLASIDARIEETITDNGEINYIPSKTKAYNIRDWTYYYFKLNYTPQDNEDITDGVPAILNYGGYIQLNPYALIKLGASISETAAGASHDSSGTKKDGMTIKARAVMYNKIITDAFVQISDDVDMTLAPILYLQPNNSSDEHIFHVSGMYNYVLTKTGTNGLPPGKYLRIEVSENVDLADYSVNYFYLSWTAVNMTINNITAINQDAEYISKIRGRFTPPRFDAGQIAHIVTPKKVEIDINNAANTKIAFRCNSWIITETDYENDRQDIELKAFGEVSYLDNLTKHITKDSIEINWMVMGDK